MKLLTLLLSLLACVIPSPARAADFRVYHATWNEPGDPAPVPVTAFAPEVKFCLWTGTNSEVWANPPTDRQVQALADVAVNGGANPSNTSEVTPVPKGSLVLLDAEGRDDDSIRDTVKRYRGYAGRGPLFTVYALRYVLTDGAIEWLAENQFVWSRSFDARRRQLRDVFDQVPILTVELYPNEPSLDVQLRATDFIVANLRRLYPDKRLCCITRGDVFPPGFTWTNGMKTRVMTPQERTRLAWYIRSRFDMAVVWGIRRDGNVEFAEELVRPLGWDAEVR